MVAPASFLSGLALIFAVVLSLGSGTVVGEAPDTLIFSHELHREAEVECLNCHDGVEASTSGPESFRPDMDVCADCHDVEEEDNCTLCHTQPDMAEALDLPIRGAQRFSHLAHVDQGLECDRCHGAPGAEPSIPGKADCRICHETIDEYADCGLCHAPTEPRRPGNHDEAWKVTHGVYARIDQVGCEQCHGPSTCQECHAGDNVRPRTHPLNFEFEHSVKARGNELDCAACHFDQNFCADCHRAMQVLPDSHARAGWVRSLDGGQHATDGFMEMESCAACHTDGATAPTCVRCHGS